MARRDESCWLGTCDCHERWLRANPKVKRECLCHREKPHDD